MTVVEVYNTQRENKRIAASATVARTLKAEEGLKRMAWTLCPRYHGKQASSANGFCLPELPADGLESSIMFLRSHSLFLGDPSFSALVFVVGLSLAIRIGFEIEWSFLARRGHCTIRGISL